jgi:hypothetical protein
MVSGALAMPRARHMACRDSRACRAHRASSARPFIFVLHIFKEVIKSKNTVGLAAQRSSLILHELVSTFTSSWLCSVHHKSTVRL